MTDKNMQDISLQNTRNNEEKARNRTLQPIIDSERFEAQVSRQSAAYELNPVGESEAVQVSNLSASSHLSDRLAKVFQSGIRHPADFDDVPSGFLRLFHYIVCFRSKIIE